MLKEGAFLDDVMKSIGHLRGCWFHFKQALMGKVRPLGEPDSVHRAFNHLHSLAEEGEFLSPKFRQAADAAWALYNNLTGENKMESSWRTDNRGIRWQMLFDIAARTIRSKIPGTSNVVSFMRTIAATGSFTKSSLLTCLPGPVLCGRT